MSSVEIPVYEWCYNSNMIFNPQLIQEWDIFRTVKNATGSQFTASRYDNDPLCWLKVYIFQWLNKQYA